MARIKSTGTSDLFRELPSVDELLRTPEIAALSKSHGTAALTDAARAVLAALRTEISSGLLDASGVRLALTGIRDVIEKQIGRALAPSLRAVVNATGVILHTNLGRAPLADAVIEHIQATARTYSNLEFDIEVGERGKRDAHVDRLFQRLLQEAAGQRDISTVVVNNNAAAVLLALNTLADGGEVIVSRGELVEIGGSFRIPDVMSKSGAVLREVGTTNRTRIGDYKDAITERTRLLLRVHRSNFEITGFTEQPSTAELVALSRDRKIPLLEDLGSGALLDLQSLGLHGEPTVLSSLAAGADVVTYSGDKLLGGPQAGLLTGRKEFIARMRSNSLFRALRVDKLVYAALEATLLAYVKRDYAGIPTLRMMSVRKQEIEARATFLVSKIRTKSGQLRLEIVEGNSLIGGGAAPSSVLPTCLIAVTHEHLSADQLAARLRANNPSIVTRVENGQVLLDLRTVFPEQDAMIADAFLRIA